jgi:hypothetical protein
MALTRSMPVTWGHVTGVLPPLFGIGFLEANLKKTSYCFLDYTGEKSYFPYSNFTRADNYHSLVAYAPKPFGQCSFLSTATALMYLTPLRAVVCVSIACSLYSITFRKDNSSQIRPNPDKRERGNYVSVCEDINVRDFGRAASELRRHIIWAAAPAAEG